MATGEIPLEEAIRLGLVPDEMLQRLSGRGLLRSPFLPGQVAARQSPFWRLPRLIRPPGTERAGAAAEAQVPGLRGAAPRARRVGLERRRLEDEADFGLWDPRFGLGPLQFGFPLSPPAPALRGGQPPVGRARGRGSQVAAPLEALLGRGDVNEIARRIEQGLLDPSLVPPSVMAAVAPLLRPSGGGRVARSAPAAPPAPAPRPAPAARPAPAQPSGGGAEVSRAIGAARLAKAAAGLAEPVLRGLAPGLEVPEAGIGPDFTPEMAAELDRLGGFGGIPEGPVTVSQGAIFEGQPEGQPEFGPSRGSAPAPEGPSLDVTVPRGSLVGPDFTPEMAAELDRLGGFGGESSLGVGDALLRLELEDAALRALRTGDASGLPTLPDGTLTPEAVQALAAASAQAGGGALPGGGGPGAVIDPALAQRMAQEAALAGGSAPLRPVEPDLPLAEGVPTAGSEFTPEQAAELDRLGGFGGVISEAGLRDLATEAEHGPAGGGPGVGSAALRALGPALALATAGQSLAQGEQARGSIEAVRGSLEAAALVPGAQEAVKAATGFTLGELGAVAALATAGWGLAQGGQAGERAAAQAVFNGAVGLMAGGSTLLGMTAVPIAGWAFAAAKIAEVLINIGLSEYKQGDLSKRIMNAKQQYFAQYGNQALEEALRKASDFAAAARMLVMAPPGTSGQVQFGVGQEFAGQHLGPRAGTTETPQWRAIVAALSNPRTVAEHPDLVAGFIQNLWVQTGPSGAASFNPDATRDYQTYLLSKLPNSPEWIAAKQMILSAEAVDPRDTQARDQAMARAVKSPVEPGFLRVNGLRLPVDHAYQWYDGASGIWYDSSPERTAQTLSPWGSGTVFDKTTGQWLGAGGEPRAAVDPAYRDPGALAQPLFRARAEARRDELQALIPPATVEGWSGDNWGQMPNPEYARFAPEVAALRNVQAFLDTGGKIPSAAPPPAATPAPVAPVAPPPPPQVSTTEMPSMPPPGEPPVIHGWSPGMPLPTAPAGYWYQRMITAPGTEFVPDVYNLMPIAGEPPPPPPPDLYPSLQEGGTIPTTGLYRLHEGETVVPAQEDPDPDLLDAWIRFKHGEGREGTWNRFQPQLEGGEYHGIDELPPANVMRDVISGYEAVRRGSRRPPLMERDDVGDELTPEEMDEAIDKQSAPEGRWYLHPTRGVPFEAKGNPEPGRVWRLAFNAPQLYEAWEKRGKDGWPLLVPASVTERRDWPRVLERARRTQYEGVHPAVLLARAVPPEEQPGAVEGREADERFAEGVWEERAGLRNAPPVPVPEPTPPMRQMPPGRPMRPEEWRGIRQPGAPS